MPILRPPKTPVEPTQWLPQPTERSPEQIESEVAPTPWYKTVAEKAAVPFEWVQEHLEKPWAATITAPWSPQLGRYTGETWLEHQRREYEAWKAPKFVKGVAEFSMPLWWLPYFGWAAKSAGVIPKIGGSLAKGVISAEKVLSLPIALPLKGVSKGITKIIKLPTFEKMRLDVFKADRFRLLAQRLSVLPGFKTVMGVVNPSALAHGLSQEGMIVHKGMREISDNIVSATIAQMERHGTSPQIQQVFGLDDLMRSTTIKPKVKDAPLNWWDIASNPGKYHLTPAQESYLKDYHKVIDDVVKYAEEEIGLIIPKIEVMEGMHYVPRVWQSQVGILDTRTGIWRPVGSAKQPELWEEIAEIAIRTKIPGAKIGTKAFFEAPRTYEFVEEALARGLKPGRFGPNESLEIYLTGMYRRMGDKMVVDALKPLGKTIKEFVPVGIRETSALAAVHYRGVREAEKAIGRLIRGEKFTPSMLGKVKKAIPEYAERLEEALKLSVKDKRAALRALKPEVTQAKTQAWAEYQAASSVRARGMAAVRGGVPGWRPIGHPFGAGRLFPEQMASDINKMLQDKGLPMLTKLSEINALSRFMVTGFDFGAGLIQGVPLLMSRPDKWARVMVDSIRAFGNPTHRANLLSRPENIAVLEKLIPEGMLIGNSEFMEAATKGLLRSKPAEAIDRLNVMQRFATSFNTFGDMARIEWAKGLLPLVEKEGKSLRELSAFLNEATGVLSSRALGIGATQREAEGAIFLFAPRYFRANMALWTDMIRGGLRGQLARDTLGSMIMGGFFWYYGLSKALGQEPNLNPSSGKFMTVKIGNQHIGLGSMQVAMIRLMGNIYRTSTEDPEGFIKLSTRDNPLVKFARSRVSPITGSLWDVITGKTFIGEPIDDPKSFSENVLADRLLPFWLSSYISDYPKPGWAGPPFEVLGARTWPLQLWERRDELRERLAKAEHGKPWYSTKEEEGINKLQKQKLEAKYEDLKSVTEEAQKQRLERGGVKEELWFAFQSARKSAKENYQSKLWGAQQLFDRAEITGYKFRELAKTAGAGLRGAYKNIESNPNYNEIMEYLNQPLTKEQIEKTPIEDMAFDEYMSLMYSGDLEDEAGQYNFTEAERRKQLFIGQWGQDVHDYIIERLEFGKDVPPLMQEYYKATKVLKNYWAVKEWAINTYGQPRTEAQVRKLDSYVSKIRKMLRGTNPEIDMYVRLFYTR